ncbi:MAG: FAD-dependent oxidoreductase [Trueperaceae bacterium]|nr:FAD-dependent oxidoreductase [Trueperaceae bacterium]
MKLQKFDAIIIGAGMAGLVSAALLSQRGFRVVVLERDIHPGGCAASFERGGYRFAVGATVGMGLEPGGLLDRIYQQLKMRPAYVAQTPAMRVHLEDRQVQLYTERADWLAEVLRVFPGQEDQKLSFWQDMAKTAQIMYRASKQFPVLPIKHPADLWDSLRAAHPAQLALLPILKQTVEQRLARYGIKDTAHKTFIDGQLLDSMQTTSEGCVLPNGALALDIYRNGCQYKLGGLSTIAEDFVSAVKASEGQIHYATRAKSMGRVSKNVLGVSTNRGDYEAPVVIGAIPLSNTASLWQGSSELKDRSAKQGKMWGAFTLYLGVEEDCLPRDAFCFEQISNAAIKEEGGNILVSLSLSQDETRAPSGKRAVTVSTHVDADKWTQLAKNKEVYQQEKALLEKRMLDQVERIFPKLREGLEVCYSGSPKTFENFTLRYDGKVGGFPQTVAHANLNAPSHRTDIKGLFLAGDTIFPGQGLLGTSISGFNAARSATRYLNSLSFRSFTSPWYRNGKQRRKELLT